MPKKIKCTICNNSIKNKISNWTFYCSKCDYWFADYPVHEKKIIHGDFADDDLSNTLETLNDIRIKNFDLILNQIIKKGSKSKKLLDVGCASGLFLKKGPVAIQY